MALLHSKRQAFGEDAGEAGADDFCLDASYFIVKPDRFNAAAVAVEDQGAASGVRVSGLSGRTRIDDITKLAV